MTKIDFYIMPDPSSEASHILACRICEKAFRNGHRIFIQLDTLEKCQEMGETLWAFSSASFLPHQTIDEPASPLTRVILGYDNRTLDEHDVLINLNSDVPPFFSQFNRVIEIIAPDPEAKNQGRQRYRFYKDRGYPLTTHTLKSAE
jgi:DNA polymerase-3 subunit chi